MFLSFFARAGEVTVEVEQDSKEKAVQQAVGELSLELMERFIEPSKLKAQKTRIQKIISTYSNRYILYTQAGSILKKEDGASVIKVTIGFSEKNLKQILLQEDLFYSGGSYLRVFPLILFEDLAADESYAWWIRQSDPVSDSMKNQISQFYDQVQQTFMSYGFFLINPEKAGSGWFIPEELRFKKPKKKYVFDLALFFQSYLVMTGAIKVRESDMESILNLKMELTVYHAKSGRTLASVERFEKIKKDEAEHTRPLSLFLKKNPHFAKSLGAQLKSIYETGQLSANVFRLTVRGDLSYSAYDRFQKLLMKQIPEIRNLKEHIIRNRFLTYIMNVASDPKTLSEKIKTTNFAGFKVQVYRVSAKEIVLKVEVAPLS